MPTIDEVVKKYIELRDRKAEIAKRHQEELAPLNEAMGHIEAWLMNKLNEMGADSIKTPHGTPYKARSNSVKLADAGAFKGHIFAPAVDAIYSVVAGMGYAIDSAIKQVFMDALQASAKWDMVDFRAGKKGVIEYLEHTHQLPPGVEVETTAVVNVRRS